MGDSEITVDEAGRERAKAKQRDDQSPEKGSVSVLKTIEPEGLCAIGEGEWECIELAVDSGASICGNSGWSSK